MSSKPNPSQNNPIHSPGNSMTLYARAAANLYGVINFDEFFKILEEYFGKGSLSKEKVFSFLWAEKEPDPVYYVQDELILHSSISPDEAERYYRQIMRNADSRTGKQKRILPEKEFLLYADPSFCKETDGTRKMKDFLASEFGLSQEEIQEIVTEMDFVCRSGSLPTLVGDALRRRGITCSRRYDSLLLAYGCEIDGQARRWNDLGYTGRELSRIMS